MERLDDSWKNDMRIQPKSYECGHCGNLTGVNIGYETTNRLGYIYFCGFCNQPTYFTVDGDQLPAPVFGGSVENVPANLAQLYEEARQCTGVGAYTAAVMCCRKLLMNIAVEEGASEGESFLAYVNYLEANHYVSPKSKQWVDEIRKLGNEANHEIDPKTQEEAEIAIKFSEMLLRVLYEYPSHVSQNP